MTEDQLIALVQTTIQRAAKETTGILGAEVVEEVSAGRYRVRLGTGAEVVVGVKGACAKPVPGQTVDLTRVGGLLAIDGPSGYG